MYMYVHVYACHNNCCNNIIAFFYSHYQQVETGTHGDEGQGATADDSQGTKESEDERGADFKRQRSSNKDKKGVREKGREREREREREHT